MVPKIVKRVVDARELGGVVIRKVAGKNWMEMAENRAQWERIMSSSGLRQVDYVILRADRPEFSDMETYGVLEKIAIEF